MLSPNVLSSLFNKIESCAVCYIINYRNIKKIDKHKILSKKGLFFI